VRPWQPGDRLRLRAGSRTLQDLFTDRKVPRERRAHVPVVVSGEEIAWVPGVAAAEPFLAGPATRRRLAMSFSLDRQRKRGLSSDVT
jgi:tRNA(Ile)-lysidine synthase